MFAITLNHFDSFLGESSSVEFVGPRGRLATTLAGLENHEMCITIRSRVEDQASGFASVHAQKTV